MLPSLWTAEQIDRVLALQGDDSLQESRRVRVDLRRFRAPTKAASVFPQELMARCRAVPLYSSRGRLVVAMENPLDVDAIQQLRFFTGQRIVPVGAAPAEIRHAIDVAQGKAPVEPQPDAGPSSGESAAGDVSVESDNAVVQLVNRIITDAHEAGASDIHIEPRRAGGLQVRLRRDGELHDYLTLPAEQGPALVSRIKIMASLDIAERRKAQDGKIDFARFGARRIELRVVTIPLARGQEGLVLRILSSARALPMAELGFGARILRGMREAVEQPHGLIVVCGPTGSGKTTTLHSLLGHLNTGRRKIWTAEDPIEITQDGLAQVQVNARIGWSFAAALRAFLRADPDVIMVGEMRDRETAAIAVEAALTGHLVMSTLHTNGAPDAATRLVDMGLDPFSCSDALIGVLAQRLARAVCSKCAQVRPATAEELNVFAAEYQDETSREPWPFQSQNRFETLLATPIGCPACAYTGYRGRVGFYEWMPVSPRLRILLQRHNNAEELRQAAAAEGMKSLRQDGIEKALKGLTTLEQVRAVCGIRATRDTEAHSKERAGRLKVLEGRSA